MTFDWGEVKNRVLKRACELIRTGEFRQGTPVRELLIRSLSDVTGLPIATVRRDVESLPDFLWAPVESELQLLYARCAQVVPPPEPPPAPPSDPESSSGGGYVAAAGIALALFLGFTLSRRKA